jgi:hypothetical protein
MNMNRALVASASFVALLLAASVASTAAHAANSAAGIYKGTYASYSAGGDYGTVSIVINNQGGTTCDFSSTPNGYGTITTDGSVTSTSPYLAMSCAEGVSNGGEWYAASNSSSLAGGTITGTWTSIVGVMTGPPEPTGSFEASYVSALTAIDPAAMAGIWQGDWLGNLTVLPATAGLVITYIGQNFASDSEPGTPAAGSPLWLVSGVGPTTILPGTAVTLPMYAPADPTPTQPFPSTIAQWGSITITFLDCRTATALLSGPIGETGFNLELLADVAGAAGLLRSGS